MLTTRQAASSTYQQPTAGVEATPSDLQATVRPARQRERWGWIAAGVLLAIFVAVSWLGRMPGIWTGQDDVQYLLLSRALKAFSYREMFRVDTPIPIMYPPGYPALLAIWSLLPVGPDQFDWLLGLSLVSMIGTLVLLYKVIREKWGVAPALLCLAPLCVNPYVVRWGGTLASEAPYMFLCLLTLWLLRGQVGGEAGARTEAGAESTAALGPTGRMIALAAGAAILAALTRSAGATLLIGVGAYWLFQRRWRRLSLFVLASAVTVGAWQAWTILAPVKFAQTSYIRDLQTTASMSSYQNPVLMLLERLYWNIPYYLVDEIYTYLPLPAIPGTPIDNVLGTAILATGLAVGMVLLFKQWRVAFWYTLAYGALLALWPFRVARFVVPMLPLLVPAFLIGSGSVVGRFAPRLRLPAMALLSAILVGVGMVGTKKLLDNRSPCERWGSGYPRVACLSPDQASFFTAASYIKTSVPKDAVLLNAKGAVLYYYSGHRVGPREQVFELPPEGFVPFLQALEIDHVLLGSIYVNEIRQLGDLMLANCGAFAVAAEFPPRTYLFRMREQSVSRDESDACRAMTDFKAANADRNLWREEM